MVKASKKKEKKLRKKLQENSKKDEDKKEEVNEEKKEEAKPETNNSEFFEKFSQPEHLDISKIIQEPAEEEAPLEKIAHHFALPEEDEKLAESKYTSSGEYSVKYKKYTSKELDAFATDKQPGFEPGPVSHSVEEQKYTSKSKKTNSGY